ncbi:SWF/SNF helicase family protein [Streptomyces tricolor]|nr:SWF/SNF helicase family protein [Streptomyces tricolor]
MVNRFQNGETPVLILSLKAAGTGPNLTRAGHVVHFDRWWNPAVEEQATDRAYRIGQTQPVQVHRLVTEGDGGGPHRRDARRQAGACRRHPRPGEAALTELTDRELADLVSCGGRHDRHRPPPPRRRPPPALRRPRRRAETDPAAPPGGCARRW